MKSNKYHGFYRSKVVNNNDPDQFGRVMVWIPDLMPDIPDDTGIWSRPANNPIGGRNTENSDECYYAGSSYIPANGSWLWIFFENGNINRPYYFAALDIQNAKILPENQLGSNPTKKWVIMKSHEGRTVIVSDDPDDERIEITGKKRQITEPPTGDTNSVYTIDGNQTTILFDERDGLEKILIRTHKGDFFHIDVDEQKLQGYFKSGISLKTDGDFQLSANNIDLYAGEKINCKSIGEINIESTDSMNIRSGENMNQESVSNLNLKSSGSFKGQSEAMMSLKSSGIVAIDGSLIAENGGLSSSAASAGTADASEADPQGERDT